VARAGSDPLTRPSDWLAAADQKRLERDKAVRQTLAERQAQAARAADWQPDPDSVVVGRAQRGLRGVRDRE
jgi:hypothetical protein